MIALSNGNISLGNLPLFDNKKNSKGENSDNKRSRERKTRDNVRKKVKKKISSNNGSDLFKFNMNDINGFNLYYYHKNKKEKDRWIDT